MDEREQVQRKALVALVVRTSCELFHGAPRAARSELDRARDDLTACLDRALDTQNDDALSDAVELALGLSRATEPHTLIATERIVGRVLDALADRHGPTWDDARARLLTARARVRYLYGEVATGAEDIATALALGRERTTRRDVLLVASALDRDGGREQALARAEAALALSVGPAETAGARLQIASSLFVLGRLDEAREAYGETLMIARAAGARRVAALAVGNLGYLAYESGDLATAEIRLNEAFAAFGDVDDPLIERKFKVIAAAVALAKGQVDGAEADAVAAAQLATARGDRESQIRTNIVLGRIDRLRGNSARARVRLDDALAMARVMGYARGVDAVSAELAAGGSHLRLARDAWWFEAPGGTKVELATRAPLRRLLAFLAERRMRAPGHAARTHELADAGWPGEKLMPEAARDRVYTAIGTLRKLGLQGALVRRDGGYALDPELPTIIC